MERHEPAPSASAISIPLDPSVLVLGGGIVGITAAQTLSRAGIRVFLVAKGSSLGGGALPASTEPSRSDGEKTARGGEQELSRLSNVTLFLDSEVVRLDGHVGRFQARVRNQGGTEAVIAPAAIIVATGCRVDTERKGPLKHEAVLSLREMAQRLSSMGEGPVPREGTSIGMVAFLLDRLGDDFKAGPVEALRQALRLQETGHCQVVVLCRDVKVASDGMERVYRKARENGALFFKLDEAPAVTVRDGRIRIDFKDSSNLRLGDPWPVSLEPDLLVVEEASLPRDDAEALSRVLRVPLGPRGFLMEDNPQFQRIRSNRRGIFLAGGCRFPAEAGEAVAEARAAAGEVIALLSKGAYAVEGPVAEVDPEKCALCYTCPRLCPHSAIDVEHYGKKNVYAPPGGSQEALWGAARVDPAACHGCGVCVAECPARAITLKTGT
jgi:heterodisulfide reductase subunit A2